MSASLNGYYSLGQVKPSIAAPKTAALPDWDGEQIIAFIDRSANKCAAITAMRPVIAQLPYKERDQTNKTIMVRFRNCLFLKPNEMRDWSSEMVRASSSVRSLGEVSYPVAAAYFLIAGGILAYMFLKD